MPDPKNTTATPTPPATPINNTDLSGLAPEKELPKFLFQVVGNLVADQGAVDPAAVDARVAGTAIGSPAGPYKAAFIGGCGTGLASVAYEGGGTGGEYASRCALYGTAELDYIGGRRTCCN